MLTIIICLKSNDYNSDLSNCLYCGDIKLALIGANRFVNVVTDIDLLEKRYQCQINIWINKFWSRFLNLPSLSESLDVAPKPSKGTNTKSIVRTRVSNMCLAFLESSSTSCHHDLMLRKVFRPIKNEIPIQNRDELSGFYFHVLHRRRVTITSWSHLARRKWTWLKSPPSLDHRKWICFKWAGVVIGWQW